MNEKKFTKEILSKLKDIKKSLNKTETLMVDTDHDSIDWTKLLVWVGLLIGGVVVWYSIFTNGFFITLIWLIVISAIVGLVMRLKEGGRI